MLQTRWKLAPESIIHGAPVGPEQAAGPVIPFRFLMSSVRQDIEQALDGGGALGLFWVSLPAYSLFQKLYGEDLSARVLGHVGAALNGALGQFLEPNTFRCAEEVGSGAFMVVFHCGSANLNRLADLAMALRLSLRNSLNHEVAQRTGQSLAVDVGYALAPAQEGRDLEHLLFNALCDARQVAEGALDFSRLSLMQDFREVVEGPRLHSVYQPIMDLRSGEVLGWEALARGPEDSHFRSPAIMFDFAEEVGSIFALERRCREQAIRGLGGLEPGQKLFLNIHPRTVGDPHFKSGETLHLLEEAGLGPYNVVFEITERHSVKEFTLFHRTLEHYRAQGYQVAIDDVGTGYSGLSRLAAVRPDFIKVDMSLVRGIDSNPVQRSLIETMVTFADKIGCGIICEGIETETELTSLAHMGVHYGQGYYLARPEVPKPLPRLGPIAARLGRKNGRDWKCSIPVSELVEPAPALPPHTLTKDVKHLLDNQPISGVVVVENDRPLGLVMSHNLDRQLGAYYGTSLYYQRPVSRLMDAAPLIVEGDAPVEQVAKTAMRRERFKIYDHIIVTENGCLKGLVSVQKMLDALARVQVEMAKGASPLTGLPGNVAIEREIERRGAQDSQVALIYADLDHFKVYNDTYGFESGDKMLLLLSRVLAWAVRRHGGADAFLGHVGGDDFMVICPAARADRLAKAVVRVFKRLVPTLYSPEDRAAGFVTGKGRDGQPGRFPLVSVSLGILECRGSCDMADISRRAAEVKKYAKTRPGNVFVRDRRAPLGVGESGEEPLEDDAPDCAGPVPEEAMAPEAAVPEAEAAEASAPKAAAPKAAA